MVTRKTILIAEPTEALSEELSPFLAETDLNLIQRRTVKETLLTLQNMSVDVLLLNSSLLEEDCGFISIIRGIAEDLRIIICAENNTPEFESNARQQRIFYYHIKAFGTQDLEMAISNAINYSPHHTGGTSHATSRED
jgi:DNA-binding NtrC family response regulator